MSDFEFSMSDQFDSMSEGSSSEILPVLYIEDVEGNVPGLLRLPVEIRNQIFEHVLQHPYTLRKVHCEPGDTAPTTFQEVHVEDYYGAERTRNIEVPDDFWSLLLVNKQVNDEATACLYRVNDFRFIDNPPVPSYLKWESESMLGNLDIPRRYVDLLRSVTMTESYNVDNYDPQTLTTFVKDVAPLCTALRYLCLFIPRRIVWDFFRSEPEEYWCQCFSAMDVLIRAYSDLFGGLVVLENRNRIRESPHLDFRFMIGASFTTLPFHTPDDEVACAFPDDGNISSGTVYSVDCVAKLTHLILQLNECAIFLKNASLGRNVCFDFRVDNESPPLEFPTCTAEWLEHRPLGYGLWRIKTLVDRLNHLKPMEDGFRNETLTRHIPIYSPTYSPTYNPVYSLR
ncbi:hypothetical protein V8E54_006905 [Elaphomyces granulatus]